MTAVEWLEKEIFRKYKFTLQQLNCQPLEEAIKQAKEMEKEQIIDAWELEGDEYVRNGKDYYEVTFKK